MRRRPLSVVVGLLVALVPLVPAAADLQRTGVLSDDAAVVRWSGQFTTAATGPLAPDPSACVASPVCDAVSLDVTMPAGAWTGAPGGLLVAIQWPVMDAGYDLDLYVYRQGDSSPVASSTSTVFSRYEAAWVPNPSPGRYLVMVAAKSVVAQAVAPDVLTPLRYDGAARIERGVTVVRPETNLGVPFTRRFVAFAMKGVDGAPLLPDLVPTTPAAFHIESGWGAQYYLYGDRGIRHQPSCYPQETVGVTADEMRPAVGPLRCLRWDQGEYNSGDGPLELHNYPDRAAGTEMWQRVYAVDGSVSQAPVGEARFSSAHGHLHYWGFTLVTLHAISPDGSPGAEVVRAPDKGICVVDTELRTLDGERSSPLSYGVPGSCDAASHVDAHDPTYPGSSYFAMGISVGAADIYPWFIADQYIDVTNVPDGRYLLRVEIDAGRKLLEQTHANNVAITCVALADQRATVC
jgi:hypothetical protein